MSYLDTWPRSGRWALFLPVGIVSAVLVSSVLGAVLNSVGLSSTSAESTEGVTRAALLTFASALTLTFVSAVLSPRPWVVGLVMFAVALMIEVAPLVSMMTVPYQRERLPDVAVAFAVVIMASVLGGGLALYFIRYQAKANVAQQAKGSPA